MTPRILALGAALAVALAPAAPLRAQLIKVPPPQASHRPVTLTGGFGFLQTGGRFDGQSGTEWVLGDGLQYRAALDVGLRSGAIGVVGALSSHAIQRRGGSAPLNSSGDIQLRQLLAQFRTLESDGPHQIVEVGVGLSQWAGYSGSDDLTDEEAKARNALTLVVGYGFGFKVGTKASLFIMQDFGTLWGSKEGLPAGASRTVRQYTTRVGLRYRLRGQ